MLAKRELRKPTNRLLDGHSTSLAMKSSHVIILSSGLKVDTALTAFLEKQVPGSQI